VITDNEDLLRKTILHQIEDSIKLKEFLITQIDVLVAIAKEIVVSFERGNKVLVFGNGGSAADAQHIVAELVGKFYRERDPLPAIALTCNTSCLTSIANDYGYENTFSRQIRALAVKGDLVIGISTSGNSINVLRGFEVARKLGVKTVALVGKRLKDPGLADYVISLPSRDTPRIQEAHITAGHLICFIIEEMMYYSSNNKKEN